MFLCLCPLLLCVLCHAFPSVGEAAQQKGPDVFVGPLFFSLVSSPLVCPLPAFPSVGEAAGRDPLLLCVLCPALLSARRPTERTLCFCGPVVFFLVRSPLVCPLPPSLPSARRGALCFCLCVFASCVLCPAYPSAGKAPSYVSSAPPCGRQGGPVLLCLCLRLLCVLSAPPSLLSARRPAGGARCFCGPGVFLVLVSSPLVSPLPRLPFSVGEAAGTKARCLFLPSVRLGHERIGKAVARRLGACRRTSVQVTKLTRSQC